MVVWFVVWRRGSIVVLFQAEDGIRDLVRSRGLGDVYKRQVRLADAPYRWEIGVAELVDVANVERKMPREFISACLLYTSDAADERSSVDLGGRRIIKKKTVDMMS